MTPDDASLVHTIYAIQYTNWLQTLCSAKIVSILSKANSIRNNFSGH
jgi:hypothetical protein